MPNGLPCGMEGKICLEKFRLEHESGSHKNPNKICQNLSQGNRKKMVRIAGLEPARVAPLPPQSSVSANSTICAQDSHNEAARSRLRKGFYRRRTGDAGGR